MSKTRTSAPTACRLPALASEERTEAFALPYRGAPKASAPQLRGSPARSLPPKPSAQRKRTRALGLPSKPLARSCTEAPRDALQKPFSEAFRPWAAHTLPATVLGTLRNTSRSTRARQRTRYRSASNSQNPPIPVRGCPGTESPRKPQRLSSAEALHEACQRSLPPKRSAHAHSYTGRNATTCRGAPPRAKTVQNLL